MTEQNAVQPQKKKVEFDNIILDHNVVRQRFIPPELIRTASDKQAVNEGYYFDESEPLKVKAYIERFLCNSKGEERGTKITLLNWQYNEVIKPLYGWRKADGSMRFSICQLWIPKKNGKSFLCSALASYHLAKEKGGEIYSIAGTKEQADIVFAESCNQVNLNDTLKKNFWVRRAQLRIENQATGSKFIVLGFNPNAVQGFDANLVICDEIASWGAHHREVFTNLVKSTMSRKAKGQSAIVFVASTAQFDTSHLGFEMFNYCKEIIAGTKIDTTVLPIVYALDLNEDWTSEDNWRKVNPSIGHTVNIDFYRDEYNKAKNLPNEEAAFRTLLLNQFYGSAKNWISTKLWQECYEPFEESDLHGMEAIVSIDASRKHDLTAVTVTVRKDDTIFIMPRFFSVRCLAEQKQRTDNVPYLSWESQGLITLTEGLTIDFSEVREQVLKDCKNFNVAEVRFDPYALQESVRILESEFGLNLVEVNQSPSVMSSPTAYFEQLITSHRIKHNNHPILNYCLSNTAIRTDNQERVMLDKLKSRGRIDGVSATITGLSYWLAYEGHDANLCPFGLL